MKKVAMSLFLVLAGLTACQQKPNYQKIAGQTMGTSYHITFATPQNANLEQIQQRIDARLQEINKSMSTYDDTATIMAFNRAKAGEIITIDKDFIKVFLDSKQVYQASKGAFDPTVMPLVSLWGFGREKRIDRLQSPPSEQEIQTTKNLIDFNSIILTDDKLSKQKDGIALDFSAIAKGYGVDVVADVLKNEYKITNYMVEIGGEVATLGKNPQGDFWQLGIDEPVLDSSVQNRQTIAVLSGKDTGTLHLATSGNYRNSLELKGIRYSHTIDPSTASPVVGGASSVTVLHDSTALADAWATALTAMPYEKALQLAKDNDLAVLFIVPSNVKTTKNSINNTLKTQDWQLVKTTKMQDFIANNSP